MIVKSVPLLTILLLLISSFIMPLFKNKKTVKIISVISLGLGTALSVLVVIYTSINGGFYYRVGHWDAPWGIELYIGIIESILGVVFTSVASLSIWYSLYSLERAIKSRVNLYYVLINILIASLLGIVYTNDIFNAFVFIEVSTIAACGIVVIKNKKDNIRAALKYLILSILGSGLVLMGIAFIYSITGNLNMTFIHSEIANVHTQYENIILITLGLFTVGLGVKSAMFPLHTWLPDAHSNSPASASAILSGLVLKAYVYLLIKILSRVFGFDILNQYFILDIILILGSAGMIVGSILAIMQKNIKRVIAYSSVAQMGYIFYGIGLGNKLGLIIAIYHIIGHALTKSTLFLSVGSIIEQTGNNKLIDLRGVGKEMPVTLSIFTVGAFSMVGIPILPGFISKWYFALASIDAGKLLYLAVILASSLLNAIYYLPIVINSFFGEENLKGRVYMAKNKPIKELLPVLVLTLGILLTGIFNKGIITAIELDIL